jgi:hypothetical protein
MMVSRVGSLQNFQCYTQMPTNKLSEQANSMNKIEVPEEIHEVLAVYRRTSVYRTTRIFMSVSPCILRLKV